MSFPIDIKLRSGSRAYKSVIELKDDILLAIHNAVANAYDETWRTFRPTIAKDTGTFRLNINSAFLNQLARVFLRPRFSIKFPQILGERPSYGKYHIFGPTGESLTTKPYANPTTKGTRPLNEINFMNSIEDLIPKYMSIEFTALGLKWKQLVKVV